MFYRQVIQFFDWKHFQVLPKNLFFSGFTHGSEREVYVRDVRCFRNPVIAKVFELALGVLIPLYDSANETLFLGKKGDNSLLHVGIGATSLATFSKYTGTITYSVEIPNIINELSHLQAANLKIFALRRRQCWIENEKKCVEFSRLRIT